MGAILLDGVVVEKNAMVAAGALVRQNTKIPSGEVCLMWLYTVRYHLMRFRIVHGIVEPELALGCWFESGRSAQIGRARVIKE